MRNNLLLNLRLSGLCMLLLGTILPLSAVAQTENKPTVSGRDYKQIASEPGAVIFTPPEGWALADSQSLPPSVELMVVGKGKTNFPPSINLTTEQFGGTLKEYLTIVKEINKTQGSEWKDLGTIKTQAGDGSLSQADVQSEWGSIRMMHVILSKNGKIFIMTAAALKDEFSTFYKTFFESMRSLRINNLAETASVQPLKKTK